MAGKLGEGDGFFSAALPNDEGSGSRYRLNPALPRAKLRCAAAAANMHVLDQIIDFEGIGLFVFHGLFYARLSPCMKGLPVL